VQEAVASTVEDVLVGDVWILAGQSNMQGVGLLKHRLPPVDAVRAFYMDDRWAPAEDPIHNLDAAVDSVHVELSGGTRPQPARFTGVGPGVAFGQDMFEATGVPQGLIACAHGGTSMEQWDPALKRLGSRSLYGAMLRRFQKNGSRVAGVVWYQGESDANAEAAPHYTRRMKRLVRAMRAGPGRQSTGTACRNSSACCRRSSSASPRCLPSTCPSATRFTSARQVSTAWGAGWPGPCAC